MSDGARGRTLDTRWRTAIAALALLLALQVGTGRVKADEIVADLSEYLVSINSTFAGTQIIVFGMVDYRPASLEDDAQAQVALPPNIVVMLEGPPEDVSVRRKERMAGIWLNGETVSFSQVPSFVYIASTAPLDTIALERIRDRHNIGVDHIKAVERTDLVPAATPKAETENAETQGAPPAPEAGEDTGPQAIDDLLEAGPDADARNAEFRQALIDLQGKAGLYVEDPGGVELRGGRLFRTRISLPAQVPVGEYRVKIYALRDGLITDAQQIPLYVERSDIEHYVYSFATTYPFLYGVFAVVVAALAGWLSAILFRKT